MEAAQHSTKEDSSIIHSEFARKGISAEAAQGNVVKKKTRVYYSFASTDRHNKRAGDGLTRTVFLLAKSYLER